jgi:hypothetical protein
MWRFVKNNLSLVFSSGIGLLFVVAGIFDVLDLFIVKLILISSLIVLFVHVVNILGSNSKKENHRNT